nr:helix-turn-helix domain-containing protein [Vibrio maerlii]
MPNNTFLSSFWEGFQIVKSHKTDSLISITLVPDSIAFCPCGRASESIHDTQWRTLKEAMILGTLVELLVQTRRIKCFSCGIKTEAISWVKPYSRLTNRLIEYIEKLLPLLPFKHISELTGVHWHTIKEVDKQRLKRVVPDVPWSQLRQLVKDEFAISRGIVMPQLSQMHKRTKCSGLV